VIGSHALESSDRLTKPLMLGDATAGVVIPSFAIMAVQVAGIAANVSVVGVPCAIWDEIGICVRVRCPSLVRVNILAIGWITCGKISCNGGDRGSITGRPVVTGSNAGSALCACSANTVGVAKRLTTRATAPLCCLRDATNLACTRVLV
jgi:hypothetical protein